MPGVLVTDGMQRKSLAAVRALGRAGVPVVCAEWTPLAAGLFSRYASRARLPHPSAGDEEIVKAVARLCFLRDLDVVLPMEETTLLALLRRPHLLPRRIRLPFPGLGRLEEARDKDRLLRRARDLGIPIPRTVFTDEEDALEREFPLPAVVKPRLSSGAVGLRYAATREEALRAFDEVHAHFPYPLLQDRLPAEGEGIGVSVLMGDEGRVHALFTHKRLREYPVTGGASTLRVSVREPQAERDAVRLLRGLRWRGIAMVEFKRDIRDGVCRLLEVNPRFWGSLALAVASGVNFPLLLVRWARGEPLGGAAPYRLGQKARWLLPGDLLHFLASPHRFRLKPPFFRFREKGLRYDVLDASDPWPAVGTVLSLLPFLLDPDLRRFLRR